MKRSVWMSTRKTHKIYAIPCHCPACIRQYVDEEDQEELIAAYHGYLPLDEVSKLSASSVKAIEVDQEYLRSCIKTHQTKILKSWQKSKAKRTMVLREAEPGICPNGNTTIDLGITTPLFTGTETQEPYRKTFMLPYFNLQDLANDYSLFISLLHHRACSSPADWAAFDNAIIEKFWIQHRFKEAFAKGKRTSRPSNLWTSRNGATARDSPWFQLRGTPCSTDFRGASPPSSHHSARSPR